MGLFTWSAEYSVGVDGMDRQHINMVMFLNRLHDAMHEGVANEVLSGIFNRLVYYTHTHFADEEALMRRYNFPLLVPHAAQHKELTRRVLELQERYRQGVPAVSEEVLCFLKDWLVNHIQVADRAYGLHISQVADRQDLAMATAARVP